MPKNYEFKARSERNETIAAILLSLNADFKGIDYQEDTYFNVPNGRLKLREGNIENHLIQYFRSDAASAKISQVELYKSEPKSNLKTILTNALDIKVVVKKARRIYFIENVKFHLDHIEGLGEFVEIEAIDRTDTVSIEVLKAQCTHYQQLLGISEEDMIAESYSDLLLNLN
jgi:predicted adenylyl cyclase CyaB